MKENSGTQLLSFFFALVLLASAEYGRIGVHGLKNRGFAEEKNIANIETFASGIPEFQIEASSTNLSIQEPESLKRENHPPTTSLLKTAATQEISLSAKEALAFDEETGINFYEKNGETEWPIASLTKLFTAESALQLDPSRMVEISAEAITTQGSAGNLEEREQFKAKGLVQLMLLASSNDAAAALRIAFGDALMDRIQTLIANQNLSHTHIEEPTGLSPQNISTPQDLKILLQYIEKTYPEIFEMTRVKNAEIASDVKTHYVQNINLLSGRGDFRGGKTGTLDEAKQNLIAIFEYQRHRIAVILLGSENRFDEAVTLLDWIKKTYQFQ